MYDYKTISGCNRRIDIIKNNIAEYKKLRGSNVGTFWKNVEAVDKRISEMTTDIELLQEKIKRIKYGPTLMGELVRSEIF